MIMNKKSYHLIIVLLLLSKLISNEYINNIINGEKSVTEEFDYKVHNINEKQKFFLDGLLETDGIKAKDHFITYFKTDDDLYDAESSMKIAEFYYSQGSYLKASTWYKKVALNYSNSKYINTARSYYLNSLLIVGEKDSAEYYTKKFNKLNFNNTFLKKKKNNFFTKNNYSNDTIYSVQVASYSSYQSAKKTKRILSSEGFLCRIDQVTRGSQIFHAVRIGNFKNKSLASKEQKRLKYRIGIYDSIIVKIN